MSRGFESKGGCRKALYAEDFTNVIQAIAGDGDAAADKPIALSLAFN